MWEYDYLTAFILLADSLIGRPSARGRPRCTAVRCCDAAQQVCSTPVRLYDWDHGAMGAESGGGGDASPAVEKLGWYGVDQRGRPPEISILFQ